MVILRKIMVCYFFLVVKTKTIQTIKKVTASRTVETALICGVKPRRSCPIIQTGKVVSPGPATSILIITSSNDITNDSIAPAMIPGIMIGRVTRLNACQGDAYRSAAACSSVRSIS